MLNSIIYIAYRIYLSVASHVLAPNLYVGFGLNIFSYHQFLELRYRQDEYTEDKALVFSFMSLSLVLSYSDPRRIRHDMEHAAYAAMIRKVKSLAKSELETQKLLEKLKRYKPDCNHFNAELGIPEEPDSFDLASGTNRLISTEEELDSFLKEQGLPLDDENAERLRAVIRAVKEPMVVHKS